MKLAAKLIKLMLTGTESFNLLCVGYRDGYRVTEKTVMATELLKGLSWLQSY
jgi:hypothetical protein